MGCRWEDGVKGQAKCILDHCGDYPPQKSTTNLKTRVGVDFDQPNIKIGVNHEIQAEDLKIMLASIRIHPEIC